MHMLAIGGRKPAVGGAYDPLVLTPTVWLRGDDKTGSPVSSWNDKSGNARHFTEATNRPAVVAAGLNGHDYVSFDGSNDELTGPVLNTVITNSEFTMWVVFRAIAITTNDAAIQYNNDFVIAESTGGVWGIALRSGGPVASGYAYDGTDADDTVSITLSTWLLMEVRHSGGNLYVRKNAAAESAGVVAGNTLSITGNVVLGRTYATHFAQVDIAEVLLVNAAKTAQQREDYRTYAIARYGL